MGITFDCSSCQFNKLFQEHTGTESEGRQACSRAKTYIEDQFGVEVPCGLAGAAVIELNEPGADIEGKAHEMAQERTVAGLSRMAMEGVV